MKRWISVYLDHKIVEKAHSLGLNTSRICENALKETINRIPDQKSETEFLPKRFFGGPGGI